MLLLFSEFFRAVVSVVFATTTCRKVWKWCNIYYFTAGYV